MPPPSRPEPEESGAVELSASALPATSPREGQLTTAPPVPAAATGFGPKLTAVTAYLSGVGRLGKRAIPANGATPSPVNSSAASRTRSPTSQWPV